MYQEQRMRYDRTSSEKYFTHEEAQIWSGGGVLSHTKSDFTHERLAVMRNSLVNEKKEEEWMDEIREGHASLFCAAIVG